MSSRINLLGVLSLEAADVDDFFTREARNEEGTTTNLLNNVFGLAGPMTATVLPSVGFDVSLPGKTNFQLQKPVT